MKLKFTLHGLHNASPVYPAHMTPYVMYDETVSAKDRETYKDSLDRNKELIAFASDNIPNTYMWIKFKLKKL
jgi:hypothetical protein